MGLVFFIYLAKKGKLDRVQVVRLCTLFILPIVALSLSTGPLYGQETSTISTKDGVIKEYLPLKETEAALEGIVETVALREELENINKVLNGAADETEDGYKIFMNNENLPERIDRPDGTSVLFGYSDNVDAGVKICWGNTEVTYTGNRVIVRLTRPASGDNDGLFSDSWITYGDDSGRPIVYDGLSFTIVIPREEDDSGDNAKGEMPFDRDRLIRFGMADWKELEDAFEDLLTFKRRHNINLDSQLQDLETGLDYSLGNSAVNDISYKQQFKQKKNRLNRAVSDLTQDLGFSYYFIKGDLFEGVLAMPEKGDN